jgi:hypothetical protein
VDADDRAAADRLGEALAAHATLDRADVRAVLQQLELLRVRVAVLKEDLRRAKEKD